MFQRNTVLVLENHIKFCFCTSRYPRKCIKAHCLNPMPNEGIIMLRGKAVWFKNRVTRAMETFVRMLKRSLHSPKNILLWVTTQVTTQSAEAAIHCLLNLDLSLQGLHYIISIILAKSRKKIIQNNLMPNKWHDTWYFL